MLDFRVLYAMMSLDKLIDDSLIQAESGALHSALFYEQLSAQQPAIFTFLFANDLAVLTEDEHDYLLFLAMIILHASSAAGALDKDVDIDALAHAEEANWGLVESTTIPDITDSLSTHPATAFYDFLDDACTDDDDESILSPPAVPLVYVKGKAIVDVVFDESATPVRSSSPL